MGKEEQGRQDEQKRQDEERRRRDEERRRSEQKAADERARQEQRKGQEAQKKEQGGGRVADSGQDKAQTVQKGQDFHLYGKQGLTAQEVEVRYKGTMDNLKREQKATQRQGEKPEQGQTTQKKQAQDSPAVQRLNEKMQAQKTQIQEHIKSHTNTQAQGRER